MAYSNNYDDASFYPASSTSGEFDAYPSQTSASEQANGQTSDVFAYDWSVDRKPSYLVGSSTSFGAEASFGK